MQDKQIFLQLAYVHNEKIEFQAEDGLRLALKDGFFLLKIPDSIPIEPGCTLCREFYRSKEEGSESTVAYRGFKNNKDIYFDRENFQTEHILIDAPGRKIHFPDNLVEMTEAMDALALLVLRCVMQSLSIEKHLWDKVTGGALSGQGVHWFAASHYRPERQQLGCAPHKDTGFITILYIEQEGLEAFIDNKWCSINPVPGYFIINFGASFETLTAASSYPVKAILHRVRQCRPSTLNEDRFSFASFVNPPPSANIFQIQANGEPIIVSSVEEFLQDFNKVTWNDSHQNFGIHITGK